MAFFPARSDAAAKLAVPPRDRAAEADHRIANDLALIAGLVRMQAASLPKTRPVMNTDEVRFVLNAVGQRIDTIARLHRLLAGADEAAAVDLADYLRDISKALVSSLSFEGQVELQLEFDHGCFVPSSSARSLGLIVGELVTNALKYAHPAGVCGQIKVACHERLPHFIVVEVSDDGVGLLEGFEPRTSEALGLRLVRGLADQLGAELTFDSRSLGLSVMLQIPAASA